MNKGKFEVLKQGIARVNVDILGISESKWMGMDDLIQMTIIFTIVGKSSLEETEQPSKSRRESEMQYLGAISKKTK